MNTDGGWACKIRSRYLFDVIRCDAIEMESSVHASNSEQTIWCLCPLSYPIQTVEECRLPKHRKPALRLVC